MTKLQNSLLFLLAFTACLVLISSGGDFLAAVTERALAAVAAIPGHLSTVPAWVWWTVFGVSMSFVCPLKRVFFGWGCRRSRCAS